MPKIAANEKAFSIERLQSPKGFTLIELLIVVIIISILAMLTFVSFTQVQKNARDGQRKSDLQAVAGVLQRFYSDNSKYPPASSSGQISINSGGPCATEPGSGITWGTGSIVCGGENYIKALPADPQPSNLQYCYVRPVTTPVGIQFGLYARLEGSGTNGSWTNPTGCTGTYNYRVTPND